jgi:hypothetical protein
MRFLSHIARLAPLAAIIAIVASSCGPVPPPSASPSQGSSPAGAGRTWLLARQAISQMSAAGDVASALKSANVLEITSQADPAAFAGIGAAPVLSFRSEADFIRWLARGGSTAIRAVIYDPESWQYTPPAEQRDPFTYASQFVSSARQHGLTPILAPGLDLIRVLAPQAASNSEGYLQLRVPARMAQALAGGSGYIVIQSQSLERSPAEYASLLRSAVAQVDAANSRVTVLGGISTNPTGGPVTSAQLVEDLHLTRSLVAGYWLNVPTPGPTCPGCGPPDPSLGLQLLRSAP